MGELVLTTYNWVPEPPRGFVRDLRIRWALEEVGQPYEVRLVSFQAMKEPAHLALHPFGQIPTYEEGDLALFETGAIVFHIAQRHAGHDDDHQAQQGPDREASQPATHGRKSQDLRCSVL